VEINGKPLIWYIMNLYSSHGFNDFIIACGYKEEKIMQYFADLPSILNDFTVDVANNKIDILNDRRPAWKVTLIDTGLNTMTGGRIKRIAKYLDSDTFMLTYGDGVSDVNPNDLLNFHRAHRKKATITAVRMPRWGVLNLQDDGKVASFQEKRIDHSPFINGGFMVLSKEIVNYIKDDSEPFETYPMQRLTDEGELYAFRHEGFWKAVDNMKDKQELEEYYKNKGV
jgi:glucose-1-phosphate cytidylyltransferase